MFEKLENLRIKGREIEEKDDLGLERMGERVERDGERRDFILESVGFSIKWRWVLDFRV